jgi:hypothetical protein
MGDPNSMMGTLQLQRYQFEAALQAARDLAAKTGKP